MIDLETEMKEIGRGIAAMSTSLTKTLMQISGIISQTGEIL